MEIRACVHIKRRHFEHRITQTMPHHSPGTRFLMPKIFAKLNRGHPLQILYTGWPYEVLASWWLSGRGQGHVSNFYLLDLENFATASRRCNQQTRRRSACGLHLRRSSASWLNAQVYYTLVYCNPLTPFWTCRIVSKIFDWHIASCGSRASYSTYLIMSLLMYRQIFRKYIPCLWNREPKLCETKVVCYIVGLHVWQ